MTTSLLSVGQPVVRLGKLRQWMCVVAILAGVIATARASDPNGIYAFVDRVVFEPDDAKPERIQVWGGFALANPGNRNEYHTAGRGYMYFRLRPGEEDVCRKEWADLKSVAGTKQIVSFGSRHEKPQPILRKADAKPANPDVYPKGWGMNKVRERDYAPINQLVKLQEKKTP